MNYTFVWMKSYQRSAVSYQHSAIRCWLLVSDGDYLLQFSRPLIAES